MILCCTNSDYLASDFCLNKRLRFCLILVCIWFLVPYVTPGWWKAAFKSGQNFTRHLESLLLSTHFHDGVVEMTVMAWQFVLCNNWNRRTNHSWRWWTDFWRKQRPWHSSVFYRPVECWLGMVVRVCWSEAASGRNDLLAPNGTFPIIFFL